MPDLTIVTAWTCDSNISWHRQVQGSKDSVYDVRWSRQPVGIYQYDWSCTCKAWILGTKAHYCKHIEQVKRDQCAWNHELNPTAKPKKTNGTLVCPKCKGPVTPIQVGV